MAKLPVGLQLYGLRDILEAEPERFEETMVEVRKMGYDGVELAGLYGIEPEEIKSTLMRVGLVPISAHVPLVDMIADIDGVIETYSKIGCRFLVVPYLPEEFRHMTPGYDRAIAEINRIGAAVHAAGMTLLYHNHDFEFVTLPDGTLGYDDIFQKIPEENLQAEPDVCWISVAGQDAEQYVIKYAGRCPIVHLKDYIKRGNPKNMYKLIGIEDDGSMDTDEGFFEFRSVGFGQQIWEPILAASIEAGADWVIVEQDEHYDLSSLTCADRSRVYLKILGW